MQDDTPLINTVLQRGVANANGKEAVSTVLRLNGKAAEAVRIVDLASDTGLKSGANESNNDFLLWQLADSAFPTGGFAHSAGLEAAWQHGEVRNRAELLAFTEASLHQLARAALPFVTTAYDAPERLPELDQLCDAFLFNHVTNRASRAQGRAFLTAVERIFTERGQPCPRDCAAADGLADKAVRVPFAHYAPVFGACLRQLAVPRDTAIRLFFFNSLRSILAAAVRLNIFGPMEAQILQQRLTTLAESMAVRSATFTLADLAQTAPLLDLWQGAQDRLYSRLFQT